MLRYPAEKTMHNFVDSNYVCPFCLLRDGQVNEHVESRASDVVYSDNDVMAFIGSWQFMGTPNAGSTLVVPKTHIENIFELPDHIGHHLMEVTKIVATAMKASHQCDGITLWQNNGPAAHQTVFHFHTHVFPRAKDDRFFAQCASLKDSFRFCPEEVRSEYAQILRKEIHREISARDTNCWTGPGIRAIISQKVVARPVTENVMPRKMLKHVRFSRH